MRTVLVVGIGTGDPGHLTDQARDALAGADATIVLSKSDATEDMRELRRRLVAGARSGDVPPEVSVADPVRDPAVAAVDYPRAVREWHAERARRVAAALEAETAPGARVAWLVWGDPALYDSTLRILDRVRGLGVALDVRVVPGISAPSALAAAFGIPLNRIGEPILVTTGRRLAATPPEFRRNVVVMLDGGCAFRDVAGPETEIWWGAYLGSDNEILVHGRVRDVADEIARVREAARREHGWIMDTYLLREPEITPAER